MCEIIDFPLYRRMSGKLNGNFLEIRLGEMAVARKPMQGKMGITQYMNVGNQELNEIVWEAASKYITRRVGSG